MSEQINSVAGQLVGMPLAGPESFSQQQLDYLKRALGVDETVLFDNNQVGIDSGELSESKLNFEYLKLVVGFTGGLSTNDGATTHVIPSNATASWLIFGYGSGGSNLYLAGSHLTWTDNTHFTVLNGTSILKGISATTVSGNTSYNEGCKKCISKIIGIHRIAGGN